MSRRRTAIIVPIPETERPVGRLRARLDRHAGWGVPAHVTVLAPFVPPERVTPSTMATLAAAVAQVAPFEVTFRRVGWFRADVLWLTPEPDAGFLALTAAVCAAFPGHPPYEGAFAEVVPHLTVGAHVTPELLRAAADEVRTALPVTASVRAAWLYQGTDEPGGWHPVAELSLGG